MKWKVACIQTNPVIGQIESNISKVRKILSHVLEVDLVVLPELAITGYNFESKSAIKPYLESQELGGNSINLAKEISNKYKCFTLIGYPELNNNKIYNSAILIGPNGKSIENYRKSFLYDTDEVWGCEENPEKGFKSFKLVLDRDYYFNNNHLLTKNWKSITTNIGICMDLNPYKFESPFNNFEFSTSCYLQQLKLIICPMAWLSPLSPDVDKSLDPISVAQVSKSFEKYFDINNKLTINKEKNMNFTYDEDNFNGDYQPFVPQIPNFSTLNYWMIRFMPFLNNPPSKPKYYQKINLIICNRVGKEKNTVYTGSSLIIQFKPNETSNLDSSIDILGSLGQGDEGVLIREIDLEVD